MKLLVVAPSFPYAAHPFAGAFNARCADVLGRKCQALEVLVPRPYVPPMFSLLSRRWKAYATIKPNESRNGVQVHRPARLQLPKVAGAFWPDQGAFLCCRRSVRKRHKAVHFDAILSFDLVGAGGLAYRLGRDLGIPAAGWATGGDVRVPSKSGYENLLLRVLRNLDLVFYQSHELREQAASRLGVPLGELAAKRHVVLSRGIVSPPAVDIVNARKKTRATWGLSADQIVVLFIGRIIRDKGILELIEAIRSAVASEPKLVCVMVGAMPEFDDSHLIKTRLVTEPSLANHVKLFPACGPSIVPQYLCAADIFAFPSHKEGMPNSLLEALGMGVPAVAFAIPPIREIESGTGCLSLVPPLDSNEFSRAILRLAASPDQRRTMGEKGRSQTMARFLMSRNMDYALEHLQQVVSH